MYFCVCMFACVVYRCGGLSENVGKVMHACMHSFTCGVLSRMSRKQKACMCAYTCCVLLSMPGSDGGQRDKEWQQIRNFETWNKGELRRRERDRERERDTQHKNVADVFHPAVGRTKAWQMVWIMREAWCGLRTSLAGRSVPPALSMGRFPGCFVRVAFSGFPLCFPISCYMHTSSPFGHPDARLSSSFSRCFILFLFHGGGGYDQTRWSRVRIWCS